ncbi:bolA-like protein 1 [Petromyzon marinus]|uniref:BolA-like protein 1 n=1 Tax=Petromyzon marinus TaxID=7757 RepID=A0AAJ7XCI2_PETMA|nr:bolA-like protein 1 [Petromyzon marinus]
MLARRPLVAPALRSLLTRPRWRRAETARSRSTMPATAAPGGPVQESIREKLTRALGPVHLDVVNESGMHAVPRGSETHFKVVVVSAQFEGVSLLARHRLVNEALRDELVGCVHALSIQARTPEQWGSSGGRVDPSPPCLGGSKREGRHGDAGPS